MYWRGKRADPAPVSATASILTAEMFGDMPFGGWGGERLPVGQTAPAPPQPLVIEPPPWAGEMGAGAFAERPALITATASRRPATGSSSTAR